MKVKGEKLAKTLCTIFSSQNGYMESRPEFIPERPNLVFLIELCEPRGMLSEMKLLPYVEAAPIEAALLKSIAISW
jgi:hypothetical protein